LNGDYPTLPLPNFHIPTENKPHKPAQVMWVTSRSKTNDQIRACLHEIGFGFEHLENFVCLVYANRGWRDDNKTHQYFETCCSPGVYRMERIGKIEDLGLVTEEEFLNNNHSHHILPRHFYADIYLIPI